jgi:hypothetical protein
MTGLKNNQKSNMALLFIQITAQETSQLQWLFRNVMKMVNGKLVQKKKPQKLEEENNFICVIVFKSL